MYSQTTALRGRASRRPRRRTPPRRARRVATRWACSVCQRVQRPLAGAPTGETRRRHETASGEGHTHRRVGAPGIRSTSFARRASSTRPATGATSSADGFRRPPRPRTTATADDLAPQVIRVLGRQARARQCEHDVGHAHPRCRSRPSSLPSRQLAPARLPAQPAAPGSGPAARRSPVAHCLAPRPRRDRVDVEDREPALFADAHAQQRHAAARRGRLPPARSPARPAAP